MKTGECVVYCSMCKDSSAVFNASNDEFAQRKAFRLGWRKHKDNFICPRCATKYYYGNHMYEE